MIAPTARNATKDILEIAPTERQTVSFLFLAIFGPKTNCHNLKSCQPIPFW